MIVTSVDFETANRAEASICAAGIAVFDDREVIESRHWLLRPPKGFGYFREDFIECHGIRWFHVRHAPEFPEIAPEFFATLSRADLVIAHNAFFDLRMLRGTLCHFGLLCPEFDFLCTLSASRRVWPNLPSHGLASLTAHIGHVFQHHNAQADAEAAGRVLLAMLEDTHAGNPKALMDSFGIPIERFSHVLDGVHLRDGFPGTITPAL